MPLHLPPITRREFFVRALAAGALGIGPRVSHAAEAEVDADLWALFSDTHIAEDKAMVWRGETMFENAARASAEVFALPKRPCGLLNLGDCAFKKGLAGDYQTFHSTIRGFTDAGMPVHLLLGNHDERDVFRASLAVAADGSRPVASKHLAVIEHRRVNWFLLDSLRRTDESSGELGAEQREWLIRELDARPTKPALVCVHHNPLFGGLDAKGSGLDDTAALMAVIEPRRQVKALLHGHTHVWKIAMHGDLHLINLPAVGYPSKSDAPSGWVECRLGDGEMTLALHARDAAHKDHLRPIDFAWRKM